MESRHDRAVSLSAECTPVLAGQRRPEIVAAVVQVGSVLFETGKTLEKAQALIREAASLKAELIVLPEALLGGYPKGLDFGAPVGSRSPAGREAFRRYWAAAIDVPGHETETLGALSADLGCHIVTGAVERNGGTLFCSALFFSPEGKLTGVHRKIMPTAAERLIWGFGDGSTMPVIPTSFGPLGAAICWENYMPLFRTAMYAKGVELWCAPTVDDRDVWQMTMRHVALEGRCFVLSACQFMLRSDCPADVHPIQGDEPSTVLIDGGSVIVSPLGELLAGPLRGTEGVLVARLDLNDIPRARFDFDPVGHYARPDLFSLVVNDRPQQVVKEGSVTPGRLNGAS